MYKILHSEKNHYLKNDLVSREVVQQLIFAIDNSNPTHSAAYLFLKLFDRPFIKRDVFFVDTLVYMS